MSIQGHVKSQLLWRYETVSIGVTWISFDSLDEVSIIEEFLPIPLHKNITVLIPTST